MTTTLTAPAHSGHLVIGIDTHKALHVAAAVDTIGGLVETLTIANDSGGFAQLVTWATSLGQVIAFGIEGTGSFGQALTSYLTGKGGKVIEVNRPDRAARRRNGKSDAVDAENAARAVLAGLATATPKAADGTVEAIRRLKVAYDTAVKSRTQAMIALKSLLVHADEDLKTQCAKLNGAKLADKLTRLRPGDPLDPVQAARRGLRSLARRWNDLETESRDLSDQIHRLAQTTAPRLLDAYGIGTDTAAEILIAVGDNPERITSEAALAKLAGTCPIPAGSGKTDSRHRLYRGGNRQLNAALHRTILSRMANHQVTREYVAKRVAEGKTKREIIRCLKRYLVREVYQLLQPVRQNTISAA